MDTTSRRIVAILNSEKFYYIIIGLLIFQALWFIFSAVYPMAFDENFHFGLIKIYAHQWSPFLTSVPPDSGAFGPLTRDSSYFYHYLMSFPYRLLTLLTSSQEVQIIVLRLLNLSFFVSGFMLFRKLLLKTPASRALIHFALLMFVLVPITPMLAAHINYDNLIFLLTPIILLITVRCVETLRKTYALPIVPLLSLAIICFFTSVIKYAFLPIFLGVFLYFCFTWFRIPRQKRMVFLKRLWPDFRKLSLYRQLLLIGLLCMSGSLFIERHGVNLVQYHSLVPECSKVISVEHCSQYGPWQRDQQLKQQHIDKHPNALEFIGGWVSGMMFRLFFAINADYDTKPPLLVPFVTAIIIAIGGLVACGMYLRRLLQRSDTLLLFSLVIAIYTVSIIATNLKSYVEVGELVAVNGRYFIPLLPLIFIMIGLAYRELFLQRVHNTIRTKAILSLVVFLLFLQGGGLLTFLIRSQQNWYWPNPVVITVNHTAQSIAEFFVIVKLSF